MEKYPNAKKPVVEYTAKITLPNGEVIEKTVSAAGTFPSLEDFDLSTREGFLQDFDLLELTECLLFCAENHFIYPNRSNSVINS